MGCKKSNKVNMMFTERIDIKLKASKHNGTSHFAKFRLLMWKNWLLQRRQKKQTFLEIILSVVFCILLVVIRDLAPSDPYDKPTFFQPFSISKLPTALKKADSPDTYQYIADAIYSTYFNDDEEEPSSRRRRSAPWLDTTISPDQIRKLPAIQKFLDQNPKEEKFVKSLVSKLEGIYKRKSQVYANNKKKRGHSRRVKRQGLFTFFDGWFDEDTAWPIAFTPNNTAVKELMGYLSEYLDLDTSDEFGFSTEQEMERHLTTFSVNADDNQSIFFGLEDVLGGIVFTNEFPNGKFPDQISYKIRLNGAPRSGKKGISLEPPPRWNTEIIYPVFQVPGPRQKDKNEGGSPGYYDEGFLALQHGLDKAIVDYKNGTAIDSFSSLKMHRMPYPRYIDDKYLVALQAWLPLIILLSYLYPAVNIVKSVVYEKEKKLKESMKMMGMSNWLHWLAWFTKSLMFLLITSVLVTILLCTRWNGKGSLAVLDNSDPTFVFFFLFMYSCSSIFFCFFLSTLFSKANSAATAAGLLWMFSYLPNIYLRPNFLRISTNVKVVISSYFNLAMSLGSFLTSMFEGTGSGLQWHLIGSGVSPDSPFSMAHVFAMMTLDMFIYAVLTWYIEAVFPGEFGVPQPFYFPLQKSYWFGPTFSEGNFNGLKSQTNGHYYEAEPTNCNPGIAVEGLTKVFGKNKIAVDNMRLKMFEGQITVLLGHNGAGKTTTMSMLTGLFPPSQGTARVNGYDVVKEINSVRGSIGICPQHDVLFDELTVAEHIIFFSQLKGLTSNEAKKQVDELLSAVKLQDKIDAPSKTLSGGMKRKLSVAIALCADSKVVILDEPTTGMDPGARRVIWDLLQRERKARTILLTTHFMEEADLLGDRIAIMANGVVQCCGSSLFLKRIYGAGYHLTFVKDRSCDVERLSQTIRQHIPQAEIEVNVAAELTYTLPNGKAVKFETLFDQLEKRKNELGISSYGASQTTMEEVFLRVGKENSLEVPTYTENEITTKACATEIESSSLLMQDIETPDLEKCQDPTPTVCCSSKSLPVNEPRRPPPIQRNTGLSLFMQQFWAMLVKKALYTFRNLVLSIALILIPVCFLIVAMVVLRLLPGVNDSPPSILPALRNFDGTTTSLATNISNNFESLASLVKVFGNQDKLVSVNASHNMEHFLLTQAAADLPSFNLHWMCAAQFSDSATEPGKIDVTTFFNNRPYHVAPISLNLVDHALVRAATNNSDIQILTYNHPLPRTDTDKLTQESRQNIGFNIGFNLAFGLSFLSASFLLFLIRERESNCKHLQFVSGVNLVTYWAAHAIWDTLFFMISVLLIVFCLSRYNEEGLSEGPQLIRIALILFLFCWATLPMMYIFSFMFDVPSTGYIRMALINMFIGMATLITVTILRIPDLGLSGTADALDWVFMGMPPYAMASAISELYSNARFTKICNRNIISLACGIDAFVNPCCKENCGRFGCVNWTEDVLGWQRLGVGRMLFFLAIEGVIFYVILALIELRVVRSVKHLIQDVYTKLRHTASTASMDMTDLSEDTDVREENLRIKNTPHDMLIETDQLLLRNLNKVYRNGVTAVDSLSVGVPLGECFGLLGVNGAGKTSTFKMLTGDLPISGGDAYVNGYSVKHNIKKVQQVIGYCPQFDAILDQLTGRETLRMFARLRGIPEAKIDQWIQDISDQLLLSVHLDKEAGKYSGGNKRKLSTGIALIGDPSIIFLDEPTSGMDPVARRHLWDVLNSVRDSGRSIILTSHSMEECEALCTRLAIMTKGSFRCIGSPQHLKSKFSEGYSLTIRVQVAASREWETITIVEMPEEMDHVHKFVSQHFNEVLLREQQWGRLEYFIPVTSASWARVFGLMERHRIALKIDDYSVTQTTLERVFLNFTRDQVLESN